MKAWLNVCSISCCDWFILQDQIFPKVLSSPLPWISPRSFMVMFSSLKWLVLLVLLSTLSVSNQIVIMHTLVPSKPNDTACLTTPVPLEPGIWCGISPLWDSASGAGCAAGTRCSRVGCPSEVIAVHSFKLCSVVKHKIPPVSLSAYMYCQVCCWTNTSDGCTWLLDSVVVPVWLRCLPVLWPWIYTLCAQSELYIALKMMFWTSVCL